MPRSLSYALGCLALSWVGCSGEIVERRLGADAPLLPVRLRRLTDSEWQASAKALLSVSSPTAAAFTPDARQSNFTVNDAQQVDPVFASQMDAAAHELGASANVAQLAPCADASKGAEACAQSFIQTFATNAYRRPATSDEASGLLTVYHAGADGAAYTDGIRAVITAVLESPGFVYVTEMGANAADGTVILTGYEIASELSYLLTGGPPDAQLLSAAEAGKLADSTGRTQEARRLLQGQSARAQLTSIIEQWLGIDGVADTSKDTNVYPQFDGVKALFKSEADAFVGEVVWSEAEGASTLFGANWTLVTDPALATFYGAGAPDGSGRVSLDNTGRRGILDSGAFQSVFGHATESAPVLRGVSVLRRVLCDQIQDPQALNIVVVPPQPDPSKTTRERYAIHGTDPGCATCHTAIDSIGFSYENFDGAGARRTKDASQSVDTTTTVAGVADVAGSYADSTALNGAIASSAEVRQCFARHVFRYAAERSDTSVSTVEDAFVKTWSALPAASQDSLIEILATYAGSPQFITRKVVP